MTTRTHSLWKPHADALVPNTVKTPKDMAPYAPQLRVKDIQQIQSAYRQGHYEMMASFVWLKAMTAFRGQIASLGLDFLSEMLGRTEQNKLASPDAITEREAIQLAEDLGMIGSTLAMRLRQSREIVGHFANPSRPNDGLEMTAEEGMSCLRTCVQSILGQKQIEPAAGFSSFRRSLATVTFTGGEPELTQLTDSAYFFQRTALRVLLTLIKTTNGAQLEHVLANTNVILPLLWGELHEPEKWDVGRTFAAVSTEGKGTSASGLKRALLRVGGFDFVPENLRSNTFIRAAQEVLDAHEGWNNFSNEVAPMNILASLGTTIPIPAFASCMTATLSIKLGNCYGETWAAQAGADRILKGLSKDRWALYLSQFLSSDNRILEKLTETKPRTRWIQLIDSYDLKKDDLALANVAKDIGLVRQLMSASESRNVAKIDEISRQLLAGLRAAA